ncbi:MAG: hypothetical protein CMP08_01300 [Xanthomonadales bacterium]|nr:hypothetical protein [Xanthomonadales bacterium]
MLFKQIKLSTCLTKRLLQFQRVYKKLKLSVNENLGLKANDTLQLTAQSAGALCRQLSFGVRPSIRLQSFYC